MATNNPRKRREESVKALSSSIPSIELDSSSASSPSGSVPAVPSVASSASSVDGSSSSGALADTGADLGATPSTSGSVPSIQVPGARSEKAKIGKSGSRPSVKSSKKVRTQKKDADIEGTTPASASGSLGMAASGSLQGSGSIAAVQASGSISAPEVDGEESSGTGDIGLDPEAAEDALGAQAAEAFRLEKQIERERVAVKKERSRRRKRRIKVAVITIISVIILAIVAICIAFSVFRWHTYDDAQDLLGTWTIKGSQTPITIDEDSIHLTDDVAYKYVIDPESKTIRFTFGNLEGQSHYRFSLDRSELAIEDGEISWWDSLMDDANWTVRALLEMFQGKPGLSPADDDAMELTK